MLEMLNPEAWLEESTKEMDRSALVAAPLFVAVISFHEPELTVCTANVPVVKFWKELGEPPIWLVDAELEAKLINTEDAWEAMGKRQAQMRTNNVLFITIGLNVLFLRISNPQIHNN